MTEKNRNIDRVTIMISTKNKHDIKKIQSKRLVDAVGSVSFSSVLNDALTEGLKHLKS